MILSSGSWQRYNHCQGRRGKPAAMATPPTKALPDTVALGRIRLMMQPKALRGSLSFLVLSWSCASPPCFGNLALWTRNSHHNAKLPKQGSRQPHASPTTEGDARRHGGESQVEVIRVALLPTKRKVTDTLRLCSHQGHAESHST